MRPIEIFSALALVGLVAACQATPTGPTDGMAPASFEHTLGGRTGDQIDRDGNGWSCLRPLASGHYVQTNDRGLDCPRGAFLWPTGTDGS